MNKYNLLNLFLILKIFSFFLLNNNLLFVKSFPSNANDIVSSEFGFRFPNGGYSNYGRCDINGDGYDDLVLSKSISNRNDQFFVLFGPVSRFGENQYFFNQSLLDGNNGFILQFASSGIPYCADLNNDGYDEIILNIMTQAGGVFVIYGNSSFPNTLNAISDLNGSNGFQIKPEPRMGSSVLGNMITVGDFNGDSISDLVMGSLYGGLGINSPSDAAESFTYVLYGIDGNKYQTSQSGVFDIYNIVNGTNGFYYNFLAGDIDKSDTNNDGIDDIILLSTKIGQFSVIFGRKSNDSSIPDFSSPFQYKSDGVDGFTFNTRFMASLENKHVNKIGSGDFNGDGIVDTFYKAYLVKGDIYFYVNIYIVFGNITRSYPSTFYIDDLVDGKNVVLLKSMSDDYICNAMAISDIDNDGLVDIQCTYNNYIWVIYGTSKPFNSTTYISLNNPSIVNSECSGFNIQSNSNFYVLSNINFKNKNGNKDILFNYGTTETLIGYGNFYRSKSWFSIKESQLNFNISSNNFNYSFLLDNINRYELCTPLLEINFEILNSTKNDKLLLSLSDDYKIKMLNQSNGNTTNYSLKIINSNYNYSFIEIISNIEYVNNNLYEDNNNDNNQLNKTIKISFNNNNGTVEYYFNFNFNFNFNIDTPIIENKKNIGVIVGPVIAGAFVLVLLISLLIFFIKKRNVISDKSIQMENQSSRIQ